MYVLTYAVKDFAEHSNVVLGKTQKLYPLMKV